MFRYPLYLNRGKLCKILFKDKKTLFKSGANMKILLVEDTPMISELIVINLEELNHTVMLAETGEDAIIKFSNELFDLVICDGMLPDITGAEVVKGLRGKSNVPIIAHSSMPEHNVAMMENGATYEIEKSSVQNLSDFISKL
jgi:DNA-binding response OmpR family regulator